MSSATTIGGYYTFSRASWASTIAVAASICRLRDRSAGRSRHPKIQSVPQEKVLGWIRIVFWRRPGLWLADPVERLRHQACLLKFFAERVDAEAVASEATITINLRHLLRCRVGRIRHLLFVVSINAASPN
jgi:hypothetical protein